MLVDIVTIADNISLMHICLFAQNSRNTHSDEKTLSLTYRVL